MWVWADALLGSADWFGGNKAQVIAGQLPDLIRQGYTAVVSAGSVASNHIQALALACSGSGLLCDLILYPVPGAWYDPDPRLMRLEEAGATVHRIEYADGLAQAMSTRMDVLVQKGYKTYYWHSDGDPAFAIPAYLKASQRFLDAWGQLGSLAQTRNGHKGSNHVFLAAGTGLTLAGLRLGLPDTMALHGISIARDALRIETDVAIHLERFKREDSACELSKSIRHQPLNHLRVDDTHRIGGYGRVNPDLMRLSRILTERSGIEFDPIYTAKAYAGMCAALNRLESPGIKSKKECETVVFWHTGPYFDKSTPIPQPILE
jgi:D-cysteine desulfhydrase